MFKSDSNATDWDWLNLLLSSACQIGEIVIDDFDTIKRRRIDKNEVTLKNNSGSNGWLTGNIVKNVIQSIDRSVENLSTLKVDVITGLNHRYSKLECDEIIGAGKNYSTACASGKSSPFHSEQITGEVVGKLNGPVVQAIENDQLFEDNKTENTEKLDNLFDGQNPLIQGQSVLLTDVNKGNIDKSALHNALGVKNTTQSQDENINVEKFLDLSVPSNSLSTKKDDEEKPYNDTTVCNSNSNNVKNSTTTEISNSNHEDRSSPLVSIEQINGETVNKKVVTCSTFISDNIPQQSSLLFKQKTSFSDSEDKKRVLRSDSSQEYFIPTSSIQKPNTTPNNVDNKVTENTPHMNSNRTSRKRSKFSTTEEEDNVIPARRLSQKPKAEDRRKKVTQTGTHNQKGDKKLSKTTKVVMEKLDGEMEMDLEKNGFVRIEDSDVDESCSSEEDKRIITNAMKITEQEEESQVRKRKERACKDFVLYDISSSDDSTSDKDYSPKLNNSKAAKGIFYETSSTDDETAKANVLKDSDDEKVKDLKRPKSKKYYMPRVCYLLSSSDDEASQSQNQTKTERKFKSTDKDNYINKGNDNNNDDIPLALRRVVKKRKVSIESSSNDNASKKDRRDSDSLFDTKESNKKIKTQNDVSFDKKHGNKKQRRQHSDEMNNSNSKEPSGMDDDVQKVQGDKKTKPSSTGKEDIRQVLSKEDLDKSTRLAEKAENERREKSVLEKQQLKTKPSSTGKEGIRPVLSKENLEKSARLAEKAENERRKRLVLEKQQLVKVNYIKTKPSSTGKEDIRQVLSKENIDKSARLAEKEENERRERSVLEKQQLKTMSSSTGKEDIGQVLSKEDLEKSTRLAQKEENQQSERSVLGKQQLETMSSSTGTEDIRQVLSKKDLEKSADLAQKEEKQRRERSFLEKQQLNTKPSSTGKEDIQQVLSKEDLEKSTRLAEKTENQRRERSVILKQQLYNGFQPSLPECDKITSIVLDFNRTTNEPTVSVNPSIADKLKPYQAEGVKFMYDRAIENLENENAGGGCILAHWQGLGRKLSSVAFLHSVLTNEKTKIKTALIMCPLNAVGNWFNEFSLWLNGVDKRINIHKLWEQSTSVGLANALMDFKTRGGVGIIHDQPFLNVSSRQSSSSSWDYDEIYKNLLDPGPDVVICDEGLLKNSNCALPISFSKIKTRRRIFISGMPLYNDLYKYHAMMSFVKPNLLGTLEEFTTRFINLMNKGQRADSDRNDVILMKKRAYVLKRLLDGCNQTVDHNTLIPYLPPKHEYLLVIKMTPKQVALYKYFLEKLKSMLSPPSLHKMLCRNYSLLQKIWNHPIVLTYKTSKRGVYSDPDESHDSSSDETTSSSGGSSSQMDSTDNQNEKLNKEPQEKPKEVVEVPAANQATRNLPTDWYMRFFESKEDMKRVELSGKLVALMEIMKICDSIGDKLLVCCQYRSSLELIEEFLTNWNDQTQENANKSHVDFPQNNRWRKNVEYFRLERNSESFKTQFDEFNSHDTTGVKLFLVSTKAGDLNINLVCANRVVFFDAFCNYFHDMQSVSRVFRFGQTKPCYIYRLIAEGTMEEKIYHRQVALSRSGKIINEPQIERHFKIEETNALYSYEDPEEKVDCPIPQVPKDRLLSELLLAQNKNITIYPQSTTLLDTKMDEGLTDEERKSAWDEYNHEKEARGSQQQNSQEARGSQQQNSQEARGSQQQNSQEARGSQQQNSQEARGSHQQTSQEDLNTYQKIWRILKQRYDFDPGQLKEWSDKIMAHIHQLQQLLNHFNMNRAKISAEEERVTKSNIEKISRWITTVLGTSTTNTPAASTAGSSGGSQLQPQLQTPRAENIPMPSSSSSSSSLTTPTATVVQTVNVQPVYPVINIASNILNTSTESSPEVTPVRTAIRPWTHVVPYEYKKPNNEKK